MPSPCHHGRECYTSINQSINQSIKQKSPSHSINQSIHNFDSINQAINQSIKWRPFQNQFSPWILEVSRLWCFFCTVLRDEKSNRTVRWGRACGEGEGVNRAWGLGGRIRIFLPVIHFFFHSSGKITTFSFSFQVRRISLLVQVGFGEFCCVAG